MFTSKKYFKNYPYSVIKCDFHELDTFHEVDVHFKKTANSLVQYDRTMYACRCDIYIHIFKNLTLPYLTQP